MQGVVWPSNRIGSELRQCQRSGARTAIVTPRISALFTSIRQRYEIRHTPRELGSCTRSRRHNRQIDGQLQVEKKSEIERIIARVIWQEELDAASDNSFHFEFWAVELVWQFKPNQPEIQDNYCQSVWEYANKVRSGQIWRSFSRCHSSYARRLCWFSVKAYAHCLHVINVA